MKTTVYIGLSLDGYIARQDGDIGWLTSFGSPGAGENFRKFLSTIDIIVMGKGTFEKILTFPSWPYEQKVIVLSTSLREIPEGLSDKVTILSMNPQEVMSYLNGQGYSHAYVDGGKVIRSFLREDLIDELILSHAPVLIGTGISPFGETAHDLSFLHKGTEIFSNGLVMSRYERIHT